MSEIVCIFAVKIPQQKEIKTICISPYCSDKKQINN